MPHSVLPSGTVTFLFTDIQGSTPLWERMPRAMKAAVALHHALLHQAIEAEGGTVFKIVGDEFQAAFDLASQGLSAALAAQRALLAQEWGETGPLRVRMGLHTGPAEVVQEEDGRTDYAVSHTLNRVARTMSAAHGGQILLSQEAADLVRRDLPPGVSLVDLGEHHVKGMARPEHFYQVLAPDLARDFPPPATVGDHPHNLPAQLIPFVGRQTVLAEIKTCLLDPGCRLLTLVGPGGSGKTRLALEAAARKVDRYAHGVWFVPLAPQASVEAIVPAIAQALGFAFYDGAEPKDQLHNYLRGKNALLILDNYEHLVEGAGIVTEVLRAAPEIRILVTSRSGLHVQGEHRFPVSGMDYPSDLSAEDAAQYSAVRLFTAAARRAQPGFELAADNLVDVVRICRLVEGIPLALLLAATWVEMLTPAEICAEIEGQIAGSGLDFLASGLRDAPERQRSMRAVFEHSWKLLTENERAVLRALSVFRGGFTTEAAQRVTGASLRELMTLVNKSLLHRAPTGRYEIHELLRQYAAEKLKGSPSAWERAYDRHSAFYTAALRGWGADLRGPGQVTAMAEMDLEIENARAAWDWAAGRGQAVRLDRAVFGLYYFYMWRFRHREGEAACRTAAEKLGATAPDDGPVLIADGTSDADEACPEFAAGMRVWAKLLAYQSIFSERGSARELLGQSLVLLERPELADQDTRWERAFVLHRMGFMARVSDLVEARQLYERSLALYQELGERWWTAQVLHRLGSVTQDQGAYGESATFNEKALIIYQTLGDQSGMAAVLVGLGWIALIQGQLEKGEQLMKEVLALAQEIGERVGIAKRLHSLGAAVAYLGNYTKAQSLLEQSLTLSSDLGDHLFLVDCTNDLGLAKMHLGQYEQAHSLGQRALSLAQELDYPRRMGFCFLLLGSVALAEKGHTQAQDLMQKGATAFRETGRQNGLGLTLAVLACAERGLGQVPQARQYVYGALRIGSDSRAWRPCLYGLLALSLLLADAGEVERAVELYALASRYAHVANSRWFEDVAGRHIAAAATSLPLEVAEAAQERGQARDLWATAEELLTELGEEQVL